MKRVNQTIFGAKGNALQACFASLLGLGLNQVPSFILKTDYMDAIQTFLRPFGMAFLKVSMASLMSNADSLSNIEGLQCAVVGVNSLGGVRQCCVGVVKNTVRAHTCNAYQVIHDPHPKSDGISGEAIWAGFFVSLLPSVNCTREVPAAPTLAVSMQMSRVQQTDFGTSRGNALQACFASLMNMKHQTMLNFIFQVVTLP
jgi:hypothetical protein